MAILNGIVKFFNTEKNFGFITPSDGGKDVFVHGSKVEGYISEGDTVQFEMGEGRKGPEAINVSKVTFGQHANMNEMNVTEDETEEVAM